MAIDQRRSLRLRFNSAFIIGLQQPEWQRQSFGSCKNLVRIERHQIYCCGGVEEAFIRLCLYVTTIATIRLTL